MNGRIAVGWLVVEDLATVLVARADATALGVLGAEGTSSGNRRFLVAQDRADPPRGCGIHRADADAGRRVLPGFHAGRAYGIAGALHACSDRRGGQHRRGAAALFTVSFALGAFFAGDGDARVRVQPSRRAGVAAPARRVFRPVLRTVGRLLDPAVLIEEPLRVLGVLAIIIVGKSLRPWRLCLLALTDSTRR
jgi:CPA2 family monovalent cation:H+ antiporter-2